MLITVKVKLFSAPNCLKLTKGIHVVRIKGQTLSFYFSNTKAVALSRRPKQSTAFRGNEKK